MSRFTYLAYPIDLRGDKPVDWLDLVTLGKGLLLSDIVYDPGDAFTVDPGCKVGPEIRHLNEVAMNKSDAVLAFLPRDIPSIGVPQEIQQAWNTGTRLAVVTDHAGSWSLGYPDASSDRVRIFDLDSDGVMAACHWLAESDREVAKSRRTAWQNTLLVKLDAQQDGQMPTQGYFDDAGFDLYCSESVVVKAGEFVDVPCGVSFAFPTGVYGLVTGRSSTLRGKGLLVMQGVIDSGYTGPMFAGAMNLTGHDVVVDKGERIAQMIPMYNVARNLGLMRVDELPITARGEAGFGSTGR